MLPLRDLVTILGSWVLGLTVSHINGSQLQTYESSTLVFMTRLQYHCIPGLAEVWAKNTGCAGNKISALLQITVDEEIARLYIVKEISVT